MILVTRFNKTEQFYINEDMIEFIEETPDTKITLETGKTLMVMERAQEIVDLIYQTRHRQATWMDRGELPDRRQER